MDKPDWLPEPIKDYSCWEELEDKAYEIFIRDLRNNRLFYNEKSIVYNGDVDHLKKKKREKGFYHLVMKTQTYRSKRDIEDRKRAERIGWIKPIISHPQDNEILVWDYYELGVVRTYFWLKEYNYLVVIEDQDTHYFLVTSFYVDDNYEISLRQKYLKRIL